MRAPLDRIANLATAAALLLLGYFIVVTLRNPTAATSNWAVIPDRPISLNGAAIKGDPNAGAVLLEYADFECPRSGDFARKVLPSLEAKYVATGQVRIAVFNWPLPYHPSAAKAAEAAECARRQDRFWPMHDGLFSDQQHLNLGRFASLAKMIGLEQTRFDACLNGEATEAVQRQAHAAESLELGGTPVFFVGAAQPNGDLAVADVIQGTHPTAVFTKALDAYLARSRAAK